MKLLITMHCNVVRDGTHNFCDALCIVLSSDSSENVHQYVASCDILALLSYTLSFSLARLLTDAFFAI